MENTNVKCQKGSVEQYEDFLDFINYVFGFNGSENDFVKLLPKLYRKEKNPACKNYIITENKKIRAAVGAFDSKISVCGNTLKCRGIGNVAVHPYHRFKGYMKECMNTALKDMIEDGIHFSTLGGRRQRYNYFGFDKTGVMYTFTVNDDNMRHVLGSERTPVYKIKEIGKDSCELNLISELINKQNYITLRPKDELFYIMKSWQAKVYCAYDKDRFAGYCILNNGKITEIHTADRSDFFGFVTSLYDSLSIHGLTVTLPDFEQSYIKDLCMFSEWVGISSPMMFNILDYRAVIDAFLKLKNSYMSLPDGKLNLLINGYARREKLCISSEQGNPTVKESSETATMELSHLEAMNLLFSPVCPLRNELPPFARAWFPLPLWQYPADEV